jgi:hypothetical protein
MKSSNDIEPLFTAGFGGDSGVAVNRNMAQKGISIHKPL